MSFSSDNDCEIIFHKKKDTTTSVQPSGKIRYYQNLEDCHMTSAEIEERDLQKKRKVTAPISQAQDPQNSGSGSQEEETVVVKKAMILRLKDYHKQYLETENHLRRNFAELNRENAELKKENAEMKEIIEKDQSKHFVLQLQTDLECYKKKYDDEEAKYQALRKEQKRCRHMEDFNNCTGPSPQPTFLCKSANEHEEFAVWLDCASKDKRASEKTSFLADQKSNTPGNMDSAGPSSSNDSCSSTSSSHPSPAPKSNNSFADSESTDPPSPSSSNESGPSSSSPASCSSLSSASAKPNSSGYGSKFGPSTSSFHPTQAPLLNYSTLFPDGVAVPDAGSWNYNSYYYGTMNHPNQFLQQNQRREESARGLKRKMTVSEQIQARHDYDLVQTAHEAHKTIHFVSATNSSQAMDPIFNVPNSENSLIFDDWHVPHGVEIPPGPAPGIKMPVRVPTPIKQEILDGADSGPGVVERGDRSEQVEKAVEEGVNASMGMPHLTGNVGPQQPDSAEDDGVGGKSEGQEEQEVIDPQYWQRKFDNLRGQFFAPPLPPQAHFPVTQQLIPPMPALPHPLPYSNQHQQFLPNPLQKWYGNIPFPSTFPSNGPQFGDFGGFSGFRPQFGHAPLQGSSSTALKTPAAVLPTSKGKRKTLKEQLSEAQDEIASLRSHPISHGNFLALQNESSQKDALIQHLQDKVRQSEEVTKKATEEKNEAEKWKGSLKLMLTVANEALKKMNTEKEEKNEEIENLKRELDAEKKKNEATGNQMKNFKEDKEKNENELKRALLKFQEKNSEQVREIEDFKKVNQKLQDETKKLEEEKKKLMASYDMMNEKCQRKTTDLEETHRKKLEKMTKEYQSVLESQKRENEVLKKERDELKNANLLLGNKVKKWKNEKEQVEVQLIDQVNDNKNLEMDRDAEKRKNRDLINDHAKRMDDLVRDHQSLLEDLETRREVLENERSELKKLNFDLEAAKEELEEEKRILELKVQDQENEKQQLELERNAEKRKIKDLMDSHSTKLDDLVRKHQSVLFDQEKKKEGLENERDEAKKLNHQLEAAIEKLEKEKKKLEGKVRNHENEKKKKLKMELETVSAELAEKDERRLYLVAELQKLNEKGEHGDSTLANKPDSPEDQQVRGQGDEDQQAPSTSNNRKSRRRGEAVDVTEPPARRQQPKVNYRQGTKGSSKEVEVKK
ncbi:unnamed protein product [Caenorhabditis nigoni]